MFAAGILVKAEHDANILDPLASELQSKAGTLVSAEQPLNMLVETVTLAVLKRLTDLMAPQFENIEVVLVRAAVLLNCGPASRERQLLNMLEKLELLDSHRSYPCPFVAATVLSDEAIWNMLTADVMTFVPT